MAFAKGVCFRQRTIIFIIISSLIASGCGLFFKFGFLPDVAGQSTSSESLITSPDTQLKIRQLQTRLYIDIDNLTHESRPVRSSVREDQGLLARLISESGLKWQAVRIAGIRCNGHTFHQHAFYNQLYSGLFPSSYQRRMANNFIDLKPEDHGLFYCFQIEENNRYTYHRSPAPVYMRRPAISHIQQINDKISLYVDVSYGLWHDSIVGDYEYPLRIQVAPVSDQELLDYHPEGMYVGESLGCNQELLDNLNADAALYSALGTPRSLSLIQVPLLEEHVGFRICIGIVNEDMPKMAAYGLSHKITGLSNGYTPASPAITGIPSQFNSEIMTDMLATHLTSEGQKVLEEIPDIVIISSTLEDQSAGFTLVTDNKVEGIAVKVPRPTLNYINLDLFWSEDMQRLFHMNSSMDVLAHELIHAIQLETGFEEPFSECHALASAAAISASAKSELNKMDKDKIKIAGYAGYPIQSLSYELSHALENPDYNWNSLPLKNDTDIQAYQAFWSRYDECLASDDNYGQIYMQLKKHTLSTNQELNRMDITLSPSFEVLGAAEKWHFSIGSFNWYKEVHAEIFRATLELDPVLENHYSKFFTDRQNFVQTILTNSGTL